MIGDDWRNDVLGARWVGIDAVFVASSIASKGELCGRDRVNGVPVIASFTELPSLLGQL
jgi:FMN phosphatase YigB (HAD superfamily)